MGIYCKLYASKHLEICFNIHNWMIGFSYLNIASLPGYHLHLGPFSIDYYPKCSYSYFNEMMEFDRELGEVGR